MNTDSRRKAAATYAEKRKAEGWAKITVWLSPAALTALAKLTAKHGSRDKALSAALVQPTEPHRPPEIRPAQPPKPPAATLPAGKVVKGARARPAAVGGGVPYAGDLKRAPMQKAPKGAKR